MARQWAYESPKQQPLRKNQHRHQTRHLDHRLPKLLTKSGRLK